MAKRRKASLLSRGNPVSPTSPRKRVKDTDWAYLAGLIDGEGCISAPRKGDVYRPQITIKQRDPRPLHWIQDTFGNCEIYTAHTGGKPITRCRVSGLLKVQWFLEGIKPYLTLKKEQARIASEMCCRPATHRALAVQAQYLKDLKKLSLQPLRERG